jgi:ubiquinone/menaquinone biosynthesis C-methylase UbiE
MRIARLFLLALLFLMGASVPGADAGRANTNRSDSLKLLSARLGIGPGDVVADVGCGDGRDSVVFATLVGERGTVLAEEIEPGKLSSVIAAASKKGLHQIVPILGQTDDPRLPDGLANLIYLNLVFHHFSQPQAMLERLWADLKPGGYLVVVDQQKGFLKDWTPMENREKQHHFTAETTVVRLARQAGFLFYSAPEELWHEKEPFVLVFRKPIPPAKHAGEPNPPLPLDPNAVLRSLPWSRGVLWPGGRTGGGAGTSSEVVPWRALLRCHPGGMDAVA